MWDIYCALCGNPCNSNVQGATEEHRWMNHVRVITYSKKSNESRFSNVGKYGMHGDFISTDDDRNDFVFDDNPTKQNGDDPNSSTIMMVHDSCWRVCSYPASFTASASTDLEEYQMQYFEGFPDPDDDIDPELENIGWMLLDPDTNVQNRNRIVSKLENVIYFTKPPKVNVIGTKKFVIVIDNKIVSEVTIDGNDTIADLKAKVRNFIDKTYQKEVTNIDLYVNSNTKLNIDYRYDLYTLGSNWNQIDIGYAVPTIDIYNDMIF